MKQERWLPIAREFMWGGMICSFVTLLVSHSAAGQPPVELHTPSKTLAAHELHIPSPPAAKKPNIVFILADDFSTNLLQFMPNVLAMEREGTTFSNYFVTDSLCCPSRTSIFTGKFPHNSGVFTNSGADGGYLAFNAHGNESQTFAITLQRAGYKTAMLGKYLNEYYPEWNLVIGMLGQFLIGHEPIRDPIPLGWDEWDVAGRAYTEFNYALNQNDQIVRYGDKPEDYFTDVVARLGETFIRKTKGKPFFIEIATFAPHAPYIPAPRDSGKFQALTYDRSPAFGARPDAAAPDWLKKIQPLDKQDMGKIEKIYRMRAQSVQAIDKMAGEIRSELAALGEEKNTYIVFGSDNGLHMGEYSLRPGKRTPFDTDIQVPLIIVGPGVRQGIVVDELVENIDLCPTFAQIAGQPAPATADGRSLVPLFSAATAGTAIAWRTSVLIEHHHTDADKSDPDAQQPPSGDPPNYEALRTKDGLYVEYQDTTHEISYYDLEHDRLELHNIAASLTAEKRAQLHNIILRASAVCHGASACWTAQGLKPRAHASLDHAPDASRPTTHAK